MYVSDSSQFMLWLVCYQKSVKANNIIESSSAKKRKLVKLYQLQYILTVRYRIYREEVNYPFQNPKVCIYISIPGGHRVSVCGLRAPTDHCTLQFAARVSTSVQWSVGARNLTQFARVLAGVLYGYRLWNETMASEPETGSCPILGCSGYIRSHNCSIS